MPTDPLTVTALGCAAISTALVLWYLVRRPALNRGTKFVLLFGIGVFPIATAMTGNYAGFEGTKNRQFCGSCHVMKPYQQDSEDPKSMSLAARHARNEMFGDENCYACHATYGMFGTVKTKLGGMRHVYLYLKEYRTQTLAQARETIHIREPFQNATCMHCHSTENPLWLQTKDHASALDRVRSGEVSCASDGCHGPAHPFSKQPRTAKETP
jgi:cytochrome c-type protein NapC